MLYPAFIRIEGLCVIFHPLVFFFIWFSLDILFRWKKATKIIPFDFQCKWFIRVCAASTVSPVFDFLLIISLSSPCVHIVSFFSAHCTRFENNGKQREQQSRMFWSLIYYMGRHCTHTVVFPVVGQRNLDSRLHYGTNEPFKWPSAMKNEPTAGYRQKNLSIYFDIHSDLYKEEASEGEST